MPVTLDQALRAYGIPAAISLVLAVLAWRPWSSGSPRGHWAGPLAIGLGFAVGFVGLAFQQRVPALPPVGAAEWLFHAAWMTAALGLVDALIPLWGELRAVLIQTLATAVTLLLIRPRLTGWSPQAVVIMVAGVATVMTVATLLIERTSEKSTGWLVPLLLTVCTAGAAGWIVLAGSADYMLRGNIIAATLLPLVLIGAWSKQLTLARGGATAFVILYGGLLLTAWGYISDVAPWHVWTLAAAPLLGLIPLWTPLTGWKRPALAIALAVATLGAALVPAGIERYRLEQAWPY